MKIYIGHSTDLEYKEDLYKPLKDSSLVEEHELVFPHDSEGFFNSKGFLKDECDLFVAEVSHASTGLGIELGWAESFELPVFFLHKKGCEPSGALNAITDDLTAYENSQELVEKIRSEIHRSSK